MSKYKNIILIIGLLLILGLTVYTRIILPFDGIFREDGEVLFNGTDPYVHMMMADYTYENYPEVMTHNDYLGYPDGRDIDVRPLMSLMIATVAKVTGLSVDVAGAYLPPVAMILLIIPIFVIGWILFGRWVALVGTLIAVLVPGEIVGRSVLGATDHHILETLFATLTIMFFILAIKKHWLWSIGAGLSLGLFNCNWIGAPILSLIIIAFVLTQIVLSLKRGESIWELTKITGMTFFIGSIMVLIFYHKSMVYNLFYASLIALPWVLYFMTRVSLLNNWKRFILMILGLLVGFIGIGYLISPSTMNYALSRFSAFYSPSSIMETMPLLWVQDRFSVMLLWNYFALTIVTALAGYFIIFKSKQYKDSACLLFLIYSLIMILLTILQCRFAYYSSILIGLVSGVFMVWAVKVLSMCKPTKKERKHGGVEHIKYEMAVFVSILLCLFIIAPIYVATTNTAKGNMFVPSDAWVDTLKWIREETPDDEKYSILSWWDYGFWIAREKRIVVCDPGGGFQERTATFLTDMGQDESNEIADTHNVRYVVIDYMMLTGKYYAIQNMPYVQPGDAPRNVKQEGTLMVRMFFNFDMEGWKEVFASKQMYNGEPQVKIFERIVKQPVSG